MVLGHTEDSTSGRLCGTACTEKNKSISGPTQFKSVLFKVSCSHLCTVGQGVGRTKRTIITSPLLLFIKHYTCEFDTINENKNDGNGKDGFCQSKDEK